MTAVESSAARAPKPANADRRANAGRPPARGPSFRNLLQGREARNARPPAAAEAGALAQGTFEALTLIGESAVRFDSRAIVAPVYEPDTHDLANDPVPIPVEPAVGSSRSSADFAALQLLVETAVTRLVSGLAHTPRTPASGMPGVIAPAEGPDASVPRQSPPAMARPAKSLAAEARLLASTGAASPARSANNVHIAANVTTFAEEVRIAIYGVILSRDEQAAVARTVNELLAQTPLSGRPVRVVANGRR